MRSAFFLAVCLIGWAAAYPASFSIGNTTVSGVEIRGAAMLASDLFLLVTEASPSNDKTIFYLANTTTNLATYAGQTEVGSSGVCIRSATRAYLTMLQGYVYELAIAGQNVTNVSRIGVDSVAMDVDLKSTAATSDFGRAASCAVDAVGNLFLSTQAHTVNGEPMRVIKIPATGAPTSLIDFKRDPTPDGTIAIRWSNARGVLLASFCDIFGGATGSKVCHFGHFDALTDAFHSEYNCTPPCGLDSRAAAVDSEGVYYVASVDQFDNTTVNLVRIFPSGVVERSSTTTPDGKHLKGLDVINATTMNIIRRQSTTLVSGFVVSDPQAPTPSYGYCEPTANLAANVAPGDFGVSLEATAVNGTHMVVQTSVSYKPNVTGRAGPRNRQPRVLPGSFPSVGAVASITSLSSDEFWAQNDYGRGCVATQNVTLAWADVCKSTAGQLWCYANVSVIVPDVATAAFFQSTRRTVAFAPPYQDVTISAGGQLYRLACSGATDVFACLLLPSINITSVAVLGASGWAPSGCAVSADARVFTCSHNANVSKSYNATFRLGLGSDTLDISGDIFVPRPPVIGVGNASSVVVTIAPVRATFSNIAPVVVDINGTRGFEVVAATVTTHTTPAQVFTLQQQDFVVTPINVTAQRIEVFVGTLLSGNEVAFMAPATLNLTLRVFTTTSLASGRRMHALASSVLVETPGFDVQAEQPAAPPTSLPVWGIAAVAVGAGVVVVVAGVLIRRRVTRARENAAAIEKAAGAPASVETSAAAVGVNPLDDVRAFDVDDAASTGHAA